MSERRLILASGSPRRRQLLAEAGYQFQVMASDIDESQVPLHAKPAEIAELLAIRKAQAVARAHPDAVVLGADTVVALGDLTLGKPADLSDARRILSLLSGTAHHAITAVSVICADASIQLSQTVWSSVHMRRLTGEEMERYLRTGLWEGKAGAYGIQDDDPFVTRIDGSQSNIVGLPMAEASQLLQQAGIRSVSR